MEKYHVSSVDMFFLLDRKNYERTLFLPKQAEGVLMSNSPQLDSHHLFHTSGSLKDAVAALFSLTPEEVAECERQKSAPLDLLLGHSYSDWEIALREKLVKGMAGDDALRFLAQRRLARRPEGALDSSGARICPESPPLSPLSSPPDGSKAFVFFNGPPGAGKDEGSRLLSPMLKRSHHLFKMSQPLKDAVAALFSLAPGEAAECERQKNDPIDLLLGHSYRNWQIAVSEKLVKIMAGADAFGYLAQRRLVRRPEVILVSSDTGFDAEVPPLLPLARREDGSLRVVLIHLHRMGCDFKKDSRNYIEIPGIEPLRIENNGTLEEYEQKLRKDVLPVVENLLCRDVAAAAPSSDWTSRHQAA
jgi:hypothetical protein